MSQEEFSNGLTLAQAEALDILQEECAEVIQIIAKIKRHGLYSYHPNKRTRMNYEELQKEWADAMIAFRMVQREFPGLFPNDLIEFFVEDKIESRKRQGLTFLHHLKPL